MPGGYHSPEGVPHLLPGVSTQGSVTIVASLGAGPCHVEAVVERAHVAASKTLLSLHRALGQRADVIISPSTWGG